MRAQKGTMVHFQNNLLQTSAVIITCAFEDYFLILFLSYLIFADLEECSTNTHNCDVNADCMNTVGSYSCNCRAGYTGNGQACNGKKSTNQRVSKEQFILILNSITISLYLQQLVNFSFIDGLGKKL